MPKSKTWTTRSVKQFWKGRQSNIVLKYDFSVQNSLLETERNHSDAIQQQRDTYYATVQNLENEAENAHAKNISNDLAFWIKYLSWHYCDDCKLVSKQVLPHNFQKRTVTKKPACVCKAKKYVIPDSDEIPLGLYHLTMQDIFVLRPFDVHCGDISRAKNGYRLKNGPFRFTPSEKAVAQKIADLEDDDMKKRCTRAYNLLMSSSRSSYSKFITLRQQVIDKDRQFTQVDVFTETGIECALWPPLYPFTTWCESSLSGSNHRDSSKISFMSKVFSNIVDYALLFELLLFHYDRWLFKTVTGAINTARVLKCSPMRALDAKTFSPGYWQWQHLFLLDAVRQFGQPSIFLTLSPFEWTFPFPAWLNTLRKSVGVGKTYMPAYETIHIANVLEQLVRGYLCGSNSERWTENLFQGNLPTTEKNVQTYFYRFEFQKRGTVHLHLLVWLKDLHNIQYSRVRADVPKFDHNLGFLAQRLQKSNVKSPYLQLQEEPTRVKNVNDIKVLSVTHPADAFALNLRAYVDTLLPTLKCSMDIQTTDGRSMVLKYVSSYVSKWHDAFDVDSLYSPCVSGHQAAFRYLRSLTPCEPEMWLSLSNVKISWSCSRTKRYVVPLPTNVGTNKEANSYRNRPLSMESLTFAEWLRTVTSAQAEPKPYMSGNTLVGLRFVSVYRNEFFFQQLLMYHPHRHVDSLYHGDFHRMPENVRYFASAVTLLRKWNDKASIREHFDMEGHKQYYIDTVIAYVQSLHDLLQCWRLHIVRNPELTHFLPESRDAVFNLEGKQLAIMRILKSAIISRNRSLAYEPCDLPASDVDSDIEQEEGPSIDDGDTQLDMETDLADWKRYLLVTGDPGCGKTHTMRACISKCIEYKLNVCVVTPTGFLACKYKGAFGDDITTDTVHAAFSYPIDDCTSASINWELAKFDFMVIDEISMIPRPIFRHILATFQQLPTRPIVFFCGDEAQQQPIMTQNAKIVQVENIMTDLQFKKLVLHIKLTQQFRCNDPRLQEFLRYVRHWRPTPAYLNSVQRTVMCDASPSDEIIVAALKQHPDATVLTVTKRACNRINMLAIEHGFPEEEALLLAQTDSDLPPIPIYKGMRITLTQNRDKSRGFVNGQQANVRFVRNKTVFATLPNGQTLQIFPFNVQKPYWGGEYGLSIRPSVRKYYLQGPRTNFREGHLMV